MLAENDLDTLYTLQRCSPPERWSAFMALAGYLVEHPELRLGQAVVNGLYDHDHPSRMFYVRDSEAAVLFRGEAMTQRGPE